MIEVYHNSDFINYSLMIIDEKKIAEIPRHLLEKVADVDTDNLDIAFMLTNNIDNPWPENNKVIAASKNLRSTSAGDVLIKGGISYLVLDIGFKSVKITDSTNVIS